MAAEIPSLFDPYYYRQFFAIAGDDQALYRHYVTVGWRQGFSPSPYFLAPWYLRQNGDVRQSGAEPLQHFQDIGARELRDPHPVFKSRWYHDRSRDDPAYNGDPVSHYLRVGRRSGAKPHPLFWTAWYAGKYLKGRPEIDPFYHYFTEGWRLGFQPNPLFNGEWYQNQTAKRSHPLTIDPLSDYILGGHKLFDPHPLFDSGYYRSQQDPDNIGSDKSALEIHLTEGPDLSPFPIFDQEFFAAKLRDAGQDPGIGAMPALVRYLEQGIDEEIDPHPFFSRKFYRLHAPDVVEAGIDPLYHYVIQGWKERRKFHPLFDASHYVDTCGETLATEPLQHYLLHGQYTGASPRPTKVPDESTRPLPTGRKVLELSMNSRETDRKPDCGIHAEKIGVFIHIYYTDLIDEMIGHANNAPAGPSTLYITTDLPTKAREIEAYCRRNSPHPFDIRVVENRGRDIAPLLVGFSDRLREVTYGVHIHTKKSTHYGREFDAWRRYLLSQTLGSKTLVLNILDLLMEDGIGAVVPDHYGPIKRLIQWGGNFELAAGMLQLIGEQLTTDHILDFPSGSMFWFKSDALRKLLDLNLRTYHFEREAGQYDGTLAHAIERSLFYFIEAAGYRSIISRALPSTRSAIAPGPTSASAVARLGNRIFPTDRELGLLRRYYAECTRFVAVASEARKPRINLLIPTIDTRQAYAGVTTALDLFATLRRALGDEFDARILTMDASPGAQYSPANGYTIADHCSADLDGSDVVEDASQRFRYPITVRDNDILLATAWWTASFALHCQGQQDRLFGTRQRKMFYLIQDFEPGFYAHSTRYVLAEQTYRSRDRTIPIFNTRALADYFNDAGYFDQGVVLNPGIPKEFLDQIDRGAAKERIVLLYARPHAERNCLPFLDILVAQLVADDPKFWRGWRFCAIGEDFSGNVLRFGDRIDLLGRLSLKQYAALSSRAALAVSLMVSPHPSYPPLEMAEAGVVVLTNTYGERDLSRLHENIRSFSAFDVGAVAVQLSKLARAWVSAPNAGWNGKPMTDWFFGGRSNIVRVAEGMADRSRELVGNSPTIPVVAPRGPRGARSKGNGSNGLSRGAAPTAAL